MRPLHACDCTLAAGAGREYDAWHMLLVVAGLVFLGGGRRDGDVAGRIGVYARWVGLSVDGRAVTGERVHRLAKRALAIKAA